MSTQPKPAPVLAWHIDGDRGRIVDANGDCICELGDVFSANFNTRLAERAAFICMACNQHAETARLLEEAVEHIEESAQYAAGQQWALTAALHHMKAAPIRIHLAKLKGTQ